MKSQKKNLGLIMTTLILILGVHACQKVNSPVPSGNRLIPNATDSKEASYTMVVFLGHDAKNCPGCVLLGGRLYHIECQGPGDKCMAASAVTLNTVGTTVTATTTDTFGLTSGDFFFMPDRSLNYTDEDNNRIFLNIPEQLVFRDTATKQFTFTGLFFSDGPVYSNE